MTKYIQTLLNRTKGASNSKSKEGVVLRGFEFPYTNNGEVAEIIFNPAIVENRFDVENSFKTKNLK